VKGAWLAMNKRARQLPVTFAIDMTLRALILGLMLAAGVVSWLDPRKCPIDPDRPPSVVPIECPEERP
jgi:hypothetical protein